MTVEISRKLRSALTGLAAGGAVNSGWTPSQAALIGLKAREGVTGRLAAGQPMKAAMEGAFVEAELVAAIDMLSKAMQSGQSADAAFAAVVAIKRRGTADMAGVDKAEAVAVAAFRDAIKAGLAPEAALASAFISAGSVMRLCNAPGGTA